MRYAAKKAGLYPRDDDEAALCIDEIVFTALEVRSSLHHKKKKSCDNSRMCAPAQVQDKCPMPKDPVEKEKQRKVRPICIVMTRLLILCSLQDWAADVVPKYATFLSNKLGAGPFYGGASPNLADLCVYTVHSGDAV